MVIINCLWWKHALDCLGNYFENNKMKAKANVLKDIKVTTL